MPFIHRAKSNIFCAKIPDCEGVFAINRKLSWVPRPFVVRLTGFSTRSVAKRSEGVPPSPKLEKALVGMARLPDALTWVMQPAQVAMFGSACGTPETGAPWQCQAPAAVRRK
jgi:hypothetical protein